MHRPRLAARKIGENSPPVTVRWPSLVEGACLESRSTSLRGTGGSNPPRTARGVVLRFLGPVGTEKGFDSPPRSYMARKRVAVGRADRGSSGHPRDEWEEPVRFRLTTRRVRCKQPEVARSNR